MFGDAGSFTARVAAATLALSLLAPSARAAGQCVAGMKSCSRTPPVLGLKRHPEGIRVLQEYLERHRAAIQALREHRDPGVGFVVMQPSGGGLGNRELVSVSGLALALASGRVALVDWYGVTSNDISDVSQVYQSPHGIELSFPSARALWPDWKGWRSERAVIFDSTNQYVTKWGVDDVVCSQLDDAKSPLGTGSARVVRVITEQYVASLVRHNPNYKNDFDRWFGTSLYEQLSGFYLRPLPVITDRVREFREEKMQGKYVIGIQVRRARDSGHFFLWEDQHLFWDCARMMRDRAAETQPLPVVFFLATDSEQVAAEARKELGDDAVLTVAMATREPDTRGDEGWQNALVDNYVLSECDDMVVSGGSTFGYVAHGRADVIPMVVSGIHHRCMRPVTSQPHNIGYLAIKQVPCFDERSMLTPETDMICSSVESVHSCASHTVERMHEVHGATNRASFDIGSASDLPDAYNAAKDTVKSERTKMSRVIALLASAREKFNLKKIKAAERRFARVAVLGVEQGLPGSAARGFFGLAGVHLARAVAIQKSSDSKDGADNEQLFQAMKALYHGAIYDPLSVEANLLLGNFFEIWGGTPRSHMAVQFYNRAVWCLEAEIFEDEDEETEQSDRQSGIAPGFARPVTSENCTLAGERLNEAEGIDLEAVLLTAYASLQRALGRCGRPDQADAVGLLIEQEIPENLKPMLDQLKGSFLDPTFSSMLVGH